MIITSLLIFSSSFFFPHYQQHPCEKLWRLLITPLRPVQDGARQIEKPILSVNNHKITGIRATATKPMEVAHKPGGYGLSLARKLLIPEK
jgi:hypothetical protein